MGSCNQLLGEAVAFSLEWSNAKQITFAWLKCLAEFVARERTKPLGRHPLPELPPSGAWANSSSLHRLVRFAQLLERLGVPASVEVQTLGFRGVDRIDRVCVGIERKPAASSRRCAARRDLPKMRGLHAAPRSSCFGIHSTCSRRKGYLTDAFGRRPDFATFPDAVDAVPRVGSLAVSPRKKT